jgi:serine/threonine-protein kinase
MAETPVEEPRKDPLIGQTLQGRYQLTRKIGEGGMGAVYEAQHTGIGKPVAVKVLRDKFLDRPTVAQRLMQEARLASAIRHEHIIDITDTGRTDDGRTFVVMELLEGEALSELLRREGALPEGRAIEVVRQVASALGAAHARGIIHRDVKPENVFLVRGREQDYVKVLDFGISTMVRDSREGTEATPDATTDLGRLTSTGMVLGTPFYMSPEQGRGDEEIDHRVDVYALGVILYECLTGEVPFRGSNYLGIISKVLTAEPAYPRALRPELRISEAVERVCLKAMAKARDDRYPTMEAFEADLDRVLAGEGVDAPIPVPMPAARLPAPRAWIVAAVTMALVGGTALFWAARSNKPDAVPEVKPAQPAPPDPKPAVPEDVVLNVDSDPPGAEIREGNRVFGVTPFNVTVTPSQKPMKLSFHLDGYEPAFTEVIPSRSDTVRVKLTRMKAKPVRPAKAIVTTPSGEKKGHDNPADETPPNPYGK